MAMAAAVAVGEVMVTEASMAAMAVEVGWQVGWARLEAEQCMLAVLLSRGALVTSM